MTTSASKVRRFRHDSFAGGPLLLAALTLSTTLVALSCSDRFGVCKDTRNCDPQPMAGAAGEATGGDGGSGAEGGSAGKSGAAGDAGSGGGASCDKTKAPAEEACLVSDDFAVFVTPKGDDGNDGSQQAPFATLTKAAEAAGDKLVLVCTATYDEHVAIAAGVRIYGT